MSYVTAAKTTFHHYIIVLHETKDEIQEKMLNKQQLNLPQNLIRAL